MNACASLFDSSRDFPHRRRNHLPSPPYVAISLAISGARGFPAKTRADLRIHWMAFEFPSPLSSHGLEFPAILGQGSPAFEGLRGLRAEGRFVYWHPAL